MGGIYRGYCSDMTRCLRLEDKVQELGLCQLPLDMPLGISPEQGGIFEKIYTLLQDIVENIISSAKPGIKVSDLDKKAREMLGEYEPYFIHSLVHGS